MAGVPLEVVARAEQVSAEFFEAFKSKLASRRRSKLPLVAHADFVWLLKIASGLSVGMDENVGVKQAGVVAQMDVIRQAVGRYES
jgi:DNA mismatch repair protein MSH6